MKKLMCAIAAVTAGLCYGSVESANVVGYQNKGLSGNDAFDFVVPTFKAVDGHAMTLKDIKLQYSELDPTIQYLWTLSSGGATKAKFYYLNEATAEDWGYEPDEIPDVIGWYSDGSCTIPANDEPIPYGQGFAIVASAIAGDDVKVVFSGAVQSKEANVDIKGDDTFIFTGNCIPADYKLGDLALIYTELDPTVQYLWTLSTGGATKAKYYYLNEATAEDWGYEPDEIPDVIGWYSDGSCTIPANDEPMPAGQGVAIVSSMEDIQLWVPSPLK